MIGAKGGWCVARVCRVCCICACWVCARCVLTQCPALRCLHAGVCAAAAGIGVYTEKDNVVAKEVLDAATAGAVMVETVDMTPAADKPFENA